MNTKTKKYDKNDIGCWIDGAYGQDHAIAKLTGMLNDIGIDLSLSDFGVEDYEYKEEAYDDLIDLATETLNDNVENGLLFIWDSGDLILTTLDRLEEQDNDDDN